MKVRSIRSIATKGIDPMPLTCLRWNDMPSAAMLSWFCIFFLRIKTRTGFVGETPVTIDLSIGITFFEYSEQLV